MNPLAAYKRSILVGYSIAGVAISLGCLFAFAGDMLREVPLPEAMGYIAGMVFPVCIGSVIARNVTSVRDPWTPSGHWRALWEQAPIIIGTMVAVLLVDAGLYLAELPRLLPFPPIVATLLLNKWMQADA